MKDSSSGFTAAHAQTGVLPIPYREISLTAGIVDKILLRYQGLAAHKRG